MKTTTGLLDQDCTTGNKLAAATDPAAMRFLITGRKALRAELEARHATAAPSPAPITLLQAKCDFLEWNARQPNPMPVCTKCSMPFDPVDRGDMFRRWCGSCELNLWMRYVNIMMRRWGRRGALLKFQALIRVK